MRKLTNVIFALACASASFAACGATQVFSFQQHFSGGPDSDVSTPWVSATFADIAANQVRVTMSTPGMSSGQRVDSLFFNVTGVAPGSLTFSWSSGISAVGVSAKSNAFKAGGSHSYDVKFEFGKKGGGAEHLFASGSTSTYVVSGPGLSAASFNALASSNKGQGAFYAAGKVVNSSSGGSSWIHSGAPVTAAPEPQIYAMMLVGLTLIGCALRRRGASHATG